MRTALVVILIALGACGGDDTSGPQGDAEVHVDHYDYTFDLATRAAHSRVEYTFTGAGNCAYVTKLVGTKFELVKGADPICGKAIPGGKV